MRYHRHLRCKFALFKCNLHYAKRNFYRCANDIFGRSGRISSEEVILQLIKSKCVPMLIYGIDRSMAFKKIKLRRWTSS